MTEIQQGWVCISKDPETTVRADDGYLDSIGDSYEWVSKLPYGQDIKVGDFIFIRDSSHLIGFSIIDEISVSYKSREKNICPNCKIAQVRIRRTKLPRFSCANCDYKFEQPIIESTVLEHRKASYGAGWVELERDARTYQTWKQLSKTPKSQHSMQPIKMESFIKFTEQFSKIEIANFAARNSESLDGHRLRTVRTRVGQAKFRRNLVDMYGYVCAATGANHPRALEAAHLYSYSSEGKHHSEGGLLLRRDIHHFFDRGLLAINPSSGLINLHEEIHFFEQYRGLQDSEVHVPLTKGVRSWLEIHWNLFRQNA
jgi:ribosomal protein L37AE/L43A